MSGTRTLPVKTFAKMKENTSARAHVYRAWLLFVLFYTRASLLALHVIRQAPQATKVRRE